MPTNTDVRLPAASSRLDNVALYVPPAPDPSIRLKLDMNEGPEPPAALVELARSIEPTVINQYPYQADLEAKIAQLHGVEASRVVCGAGLDDILCRLAQAYAEPGRRVVISRPTFAMINHYLELSKCDVAEADWWEGGIPIEQTLEAINDETVMVFAVTPNNPTGLVASPEDLRRLSDRLAEVGGLLCVDTAYGEFADRDLTEAVLALPNACLLKTFSKAWGMAGLRVGYGICPDPVAHELRKLGQPFPVTSASAAIALRWLDEGRDHVRRTVDRVRHERSAMAELIKKLGGEPLPGQANFVLSRFESTERAAWFADSLRKRGVATRRYTRPEQLNACVRITCPGSHDAFEQLALELKELAL
ncbi:MAG: histidinol-phosphate transaminase [Planctomycetota bacterium]